MGQSDDYRHGKNAGIKFCVSWLHKRADKMNDPKAKEILNTAAFHLGVDQAQGRLVVHDDK